MLSIELTTKDAQALLMRLATTGSDAGEPACLTVNGRPALAAMPWRVYEEVARFMARPG